MTCHSDRQNSIRLIKEAVVAGATLGKACKVLELHPKTYRRWANAGTVRADGRPSAHRQAPSNKFTAEERALIVTTCNEAKYQALPPSQIVPKLADEGVYIGSESSFYRVLKSENQLQRRGKAAAPKKRHKPNSYLASRPNEVWSWDITFPSKPFDSLASARNWVHGFVQWYNDSHCHSGIGFVTPTSRHKGEDHVILAARKAVYEQAKAKHPERWSQDIKHLEPVSGVWLNPEREGLAMRQKHNGIEKQVA